MVKRVICLACTASALSAAALASPPDVYREYARAKASSGQPFQALPATAEFVGAYLSDPASPYSALVEHPTDTNELWWFEFADAVASGDQDPANAALTALQRATGLTKARPGIDVVVDMEHTRLYRGREAAANAIKAGIDPDIFWKAWDFNPRISAAAAQATALQFLRERMASVPRSQWEQRGIRADVLHRYLVATQAADVMEDDDRYLGAVLSYAMAQGDPSPSGLPAIYRVARLGAAYSDARGYFGSPLCVDGIRPAPGMPTQLSDALADDRPLCFTAATDRAVQAWFRNQVRLDASGERIHESHHDGWRRLAYWIGSVLAFADFASFLEGANALVADELAESGVIDASEADGATERLRQLTCGVKP
ncbi:hypothetical protein ABIE56_001972 [Luteibacter sp. 621]|uniref:hypothetical protein n=1 Tax=Luteibacter sp. 621 TaxID=3373916 RepID=UPI003D1D5B87